jgi:hypothetical protein
MLSNSEQGRSDLKVELVIYVLSGARHKKMMVMPPYVFFVGL